MQRAVILVSLKIYIQEILLYKYVMNMRDIIYLDVCYASSPQLLNRFNGKLVHR